MKKTITSNTKLQLKKDKIATLTNQQMSSVHGGSGGPQLTPVVVVFGAATILSITRGSFGGVSEGIMFSL